VMPLFVMWTVLVQVHVPAGIVTVSPRDERSIAL
jgi:hypothetical protein